MTSATGERSHRAGRRRRGLSIGEVLVCLAIVSLFLIPSALIYRRYRQGLLLTSAVNQLLAACELARSCAINEGREYVVEVAGGRLSVLRDGTQLIGKRHRLPDGIEVVFATRGFQPAVFLPDGTAKEAGNIVLRDTVTGEKRKIALHNLTGVCVVE